MLKSENEAMPLTGITVVVPESVGPTVPLGITARAMCTWPVKFVSMLVKLVPPTM